MEEITGECDNRFKGFSCFQRSSEDMCERCEKLADLHVEAKGRSIKKSQCAVCAEKFLQGVFEHENTCSEECRAQLQNRDSDYWKEMDSIPFQHGGSYMGEAEAQAKELNSRPTSIVKEGGIQSL